MINYVSVFSTRLKWFEIQKKNGKPWENGLNVSESHHEVLPVEGNSECSKQFYLEFLK